MYNVCGGKKIIIGVSFLLPSLCGSQGLSQFRTTSPIDTFKAYPLLVLCTFLVEIISLVGQIYS